MKEGAVSKLEVSGSDLYAGGGFRTAGGGMFLTGVTAPGWWSGGLRHWFPMDNVASIIEFESEADYAARTKEDPAEPERDPGGL